MVCLNGFRSGLSWHDKQVMDWTNSGHFGLQCYGNGKAGKSPINPFCFYFSYYTRLPQLATGNCTYIIPLSLYFIYPIYTYYATFTFLDFSCYKHLICYTNGIYKCTYIELYNYFWNIYYLRRDMIITYYLK